MRVARSIYPGIAYHLIWRFVDRAWFFGHDAEREKYLSLLGRALTDSDWRCFAYALMSNHIHLGCIAGNEELEMWAKRVNSPFARWMNKQHDRLGPVIADRPRSIAFSRNRESHLLAYIHNNPVRAGVVRWASESSWTSHRYYVDETPPRWLHTDYACERMGFTRGSEMNTWVDATPGELADLDLLALRRRARQRGAVEVATPNEGVVPLVKRPSAYVRVDPAVVAKAAAAAAEISIDELCSRRRSPRIVAARHAAVACASRLGICGADIAGALAVSSTAVSKMKSRQTTQLARYLAEVTWGHLEVELSATKFKPSPGV